jgi:O-antigen/teichoic acid export membrane protein
MTLRRQIIDGATWVTVGEALALPTGLITLSYLTRTLGPTDYGRLTLAASVVIWLEWSLAAVLGRATNRCVAQTDDWTNMAATALRLHAAAGVGLALILWSVAAPVAELLREPSLAGLLRWFALELPLFALAQAHIQVLVARGRYRARATVSASRWIVRMLLILLLVGRGLSVEGAIAASILTVLCELLLARWCLAVPWRGARRADLMALLRYVAPLASAALSLRLFQRLDLWILKATGVAAAVAGQYGMAQNLAQVPMLLAASLVPLLQSTLVREIQAGGEAVAREISRAAIRAVLTLLTLVAAVAGSAFELTELLSGSDYLDAAPLLAMLSIAAIGSIMITVCAAILIGFDRTRATLWLAVPVPIVGAIGWLVLTPLLGAIGAASITLSVSWLGAIGSLWGVARWTGASVSIGEFLRASLIAALIFRLSSSVVWPGGVLLELAVWGVLALALSIAIGLIPLQPLARLGRERG